jgi:predicted transcriptional regulator
MQEQCTLSPVERQRTLDSAVLGLLVDLDCHRPWSEQEIASEVGENVTDSLNRLHGAGLIHRLDEFVWASRAAVVADEIRL